MERQIAVITTDTRSSAKKIQRGSYAMGHRDAPCARLIRRRFSRGRDDPLGFIINSLRLAMEQPPG